MTGLVLVMAFPTTAALAQANQPPLRIPILETTPSSLPGLVSSEPPPHNLTLEPPPNLGNPATFTLGIDRRVDLSQPVGLRETSIDQIAPPSFFDQFGNIFESQDVEWPTGVTSSVHVQAKTDEGLGRWVPFFSILQDIDEWDAHERYGAGAGVTYRFNRQMRLDFEVQFLQGTGDVNPLLGDQTRGFVLFTVRF